MNLNDYQETAAGTAVYPPEHQLLYTALGIGGEAGEYVEKIAKTAMLPAIQARKFGTPIGNVMQHEQTAHDVMALLDDYIEAARGVETLKKAVRNKTIELSLTVSPTAEERIELAKELGDILWYVSDATKRLGFTLEEVARMNLDKLSARRAAGQITETKFREGVTA